MGWIDHVKGVSVLGADVHGAQGNFDGVGLASAGNNNIVLRGGDTTSHGYYVTACGRKFERTAAAVVGIAGGAACRDDKIANRFRIRPGGPGYQGDAQRRYKY